MLGSILAVLLSVGARADTPLDTLPEDVRLTFEEAEAAWAEGELAEAEAGFAAVNEAAPAFDRAWRRHCGVVLARDRQPEAVTLCRKAVELSPSFENRTALAIALVQDPATRAEAGTLVQGVIAEQPDYLPGWMATCAWAAEAAKPKFLERCVAKLEAASPETPGTLYYKSLHQVVEGDLQGANETLLLAQERGLTDDLVQAVQTRMSAAARKAAKADRPAARAPAPRRDAWTPADLLPLLMGGVAVLALGVLAFGGDDEDEDEDEDTV